MIKIVDSVEVEMTPAEIAEWEAQQAAYVPPEAGPYELPKSVFISRMSNTEASQFDGMLQEAGAMFRLTFNLAQPLVQGDDFWLTLRGGLINLNWDEERVDALLARG